MGEGTPAAGRVWPGSRGSIFNKVPTVVFCPLTLLQHPTPHGQEFPLLALFPPVFTRSQARQWFATEIPQTTPPTHLPAQGVFALYTPAATWAKLPACCKCASGRSVKVRAVTGSCRLQGRHLSTSACSSCTTGRRRAHLPAFVSSTVVPLEAAGSLHSMQRPWASHFVQPVSYGWAVHLQHRQAGGLGRCSHASLVVRKHRCVTVTATYALAP